MSLMELPKLESVDPATLSATELFMCSNLAETPEEESVLHLEQELHVAALQNPNDVAAFVSDVTQACESGVALVDAKSWGRIATVVAFAISHQAKETGDRLLHGLLTSCSPEVRQGSWEHVHQEHKTGALPYAQYYPLWTVKHLGSADS